MRDTAARDAYEATVSGRECALDGAFVEAWRTMRRAWRRTVVVPASIAARGWLPALFAALFLMLLCGCPSDELLAAWALTCLFAWTGAVRALAFVSAASTASLRGEAKSIAELRGVARRRTPAALGVALLEWLGVYLGLLGLIVPGLRALVSCSLASTVAVLEELGPRASIARSAALVREHRDPLFVRLALFDVARLSVLAAVFVELVPWERFPYGEPLPHVAFAMSVTFGAVALPFALLRRVLCAVVYVRLTPAQSTVRT